MLNWQTGTLTEPYIDLAITIPIKNQVFQSPESELKNLSETDPLIVSIVSCHSLISIEDQLIGSSMDKKIFEASHWKFRNGSLL